jgi:hypothetical protein
MRRLLAIWSAVGLLCGALGCHSSCCSSGLGDGVHKVHGRCDCEEPEYGCHWEGYMHGGHAAAPAPAMAMPPAGLPAGPPAEQLKTLPKDVTPPTPKEVLPNKDD